MPTDRAIYTLYAIFISLLIAGTFFFGLLGLGLAFLAIALFFGVLAIDGGALILSGILLAISASCIVMSFIF